MFMRDQEGDNPSVSLLLTAINSHRDDVNYVSERSGGRQPTVSLLLTGINSHRDDVNYVSERSGGR